MIRKLFSHTIIYGAAPHVSKLASFFILPIITQYLTPLDYGVYGVVTATTGSISVLASLGLRVNLVNSFYKSTYRYKLLWRQLYGFLSLWVIPYSFISIGLVYFIVPTEAKDNIFLILVLNLSPVLLFGQTNIIATTFYQVNKKPIPIAWRTALSGTLTVILNWYLIAELKLGYLGWFWSTFIVSMLSNMSYWVPLNLKYKITPIFNFKWKTLRRSLKISLPTVPHYYSTYLLNTSDRMIMELVNVNTVNIGKYNVAYTFGNYFSNLGNASGLAIGPLLNECYKNGEEKKARSLIFMQQIFFFFSSFVVSIWLKELFAFFIRNNELNTMYALGIIIVMAYNYRPMYFGANAKLFYNEKTNILWRVSFVAGASNAIMNFFLIPIFGFEVAAYTTFISLMYMGYSGYYTRSFKKLKTINYYPLFWLLATVLITVAAFFCVEISWKLKALITFILLPLATYIFIELRKRTR